MRLRGPRHTRRQRQAAPRRSLADAEPRGCCVARSQTQPGARPMVQVVARSLRPRAWSSNGVCKVDRSTGADDWVEEPNSWDAFADRPSSQR